MYYTIHFLAVGEILIVIIITGSNNKPLPIKKLLIYEYITTNFFLSSLPLFNPLCEWNKLHKCFTKTNSSLHLKMITLIHSQFKLKNYNIITSKNLHPPTPHFHKSAVSYFLANHRWLCSRGDPTARSANIRWLCKWSQQGIVHRPIWKGTHKP